MADSSTSLDRLHDIVLPPDVSWWPWAPGWFVVLAVVLGLVFVLFHRSWTIWKRNAYRRAALRELKDANDVGAIAELLRRTALAIESRSVVAAMNGTAWLDWLAAQCAEPMSAIVRGQLSAGVYGRGAQNTDTTVLNSYAATWIKRHSPKEKGSNGETE